MRHFLITLFFMLHAAPISGMRTKNPTTVRGEWKYLVRNFAQNGETIFGKITTRNGWVDFAKMKTLQEKNSWQIAILLEKNSELIRELIFQAPWYQENQETENQETENQETENQETENQETDDQEMENQEMDDQEMENQETDDQEIENNDSPENVLQAFPVCYEQNNVTEQFFLYPGPKKPNGSGVLVIKENIMTISLLKHGISFKMREGDRTKSQKDYLSFSMRGLEIKGYLPGSCK